MRIADLDTPVLLVDLDRMERNVRRMADFARGAGVRLRPHVKTHKIPALAHLQLAAGAQGVTVAKLGEAEVMADAGVTDILVCYPIVGAEKLTRLAQLARRAKITIAIDSFEVASGLAEAARSHDVDFDVFLEVDCGLHRCGLPPGEPVVRLARQIAHLGRIGVTGICTHAGHAIRATTTDERDAIARFEGECVVVTRDRLEAAGIPVRELSVGSSATVRVSGMVLTDIQLARLSEERGVVLLQNGGPPLAIGDRVEIIPNHACAALNLFDTLVGVRNGTVERTWPVLARGKVR